MKVVSDLSDAALNQPSVLSIGNFDGLHLGHDRILRTVVEHAKRLGAQSAVITFDPHPVRVLNPSRAPKLISTLSQKLALIERRGVEFACVLKFDHAFASLSPDAFVERYLIEGFHAKAVCVGANFTFGKAQAGTTATLRRWSDRFDVIEVPAVTVRGVVASSTQIRRRIEEGRVERTCRLLGRWFEIEGPIVSGNARGRNITVPTLNLAPENELLPARGVYVTRISLDGAELLESVTNVGTRPTFDGESLSVETFVLDRLVPQRVHRARLQFLRRLRDERRFDSPDLLRQQIGRDVHAASKFFRLLRSAQAALRGR